MSQTPQLFLRRNLSLRFYRSGSGDSYIHRYSYTTQKWQAYGKYIQGDDNNAYINGLDYVDGKLYTSWTVRETPDANTNHGFYFAYSDDAGRTWYNTKGEKLSSPISTSLESTLIEDVPQNSQMVNQEGQFVDAKGRFHGLMRDNLSGSSLYQHYLRDTDGMADSPHPLASISVANLSNTLLGTWTKTAINPGDISPPTLYLLRGKLAADASGETLIAMLPDEPKLELHIYTSTAAGGFKDWKLLAVVPNASTEPQFDRNRLRDHNVLSIFVRQGGGYPDRKLQVWDFQLEF